jgi:hypothetical protein
MITNICNKLVFYPSKLFRPSLKNSLALYENLQITDKNSFMTPGRGPNIIKKFTDIIYGCSY